MSPHLYADDAQVGGFCRPSNVGMFSSSISDCLRRVSRWMKSNRLQLNSSKTEVQRCTTSRRQHLLPASALPVDGVMVDPVTSVRDLGIYIDADLSIDTRTHAQRTISRCFRTSSVAMDSPARTANHIPYTGGRSCSVATWQRRASIRLTCLSCTSVSVCLYWTRRHGWYTNYVAPNTSLARLSVYTVPWLHVPERIQYKIAVLAYKLLRGTLSGLTCPCVEFTL